MISKSLVLAITSSLLTAATARAAEAEVQETHQFRTGIQLGVGAGGIVTPTFVSGSPVFLGGLASFEIDIPMGRLGLHLSPILGGGAAPGSSDPRFIRAETVSLGAFLLDTQLRLAFTPTVSGGVGGLFGLAFGQVGQSAALGFWFGPSLTPVAVRLADRHELSAWIGLAFLAGPNGVGLGGLLPSVRYAFYF